MKRKIKIHNQQFMNPQQDFDDVLYDIEEMKEQGVYLFDENEVLVTDENKSNALTIQKWMVETLTAQDKITSTADIDQLAKLISHIFTYKVTPVQVAIASAMTGFFFAQKEGKTYFNISDNSIAILKQESASGLKLKETELEDVLEANPNLELYGFVHEDSEGFNERRDELFHDEEIVEEVKLWIQTNMVSMQTINYCHDSYELKDMADTDMGRYTSNGHFIAAALMAGYKCKIIGPLLPILSGSNPNANFNMTTASIKKVNVQ